MDGFICPTCGCSLIRLGIDPKSSPKAEFKGKVYHFCCEECKEIFLQDPERFLEEVKDLFVCPVCLGEKHVSVGVEKTWNGMTLTFCRCPHCFSEFTKNPEYYMRRLKGEEPPTGPFSQISGCH